MKPATVHEIRKELEHLAPQDLSKLVLRLARFKKDNKELLSYLLFDSFNEPEYVNQIKAQMEEDFSLMNSSSYFLMKKTVRKVLRYVKKFSKYSERKETEIELHIHFLFLLKSVYPPMEESRVLFGLFHRELLGVKKKIKALHEDVQGDYFYELEEKGLVK